MKTYIKTIFLTFCFMMLFKMPDVQAAYNNDLIWPALNIDLFKNAPSADVWLSRDTKEENVSFTLYISDAMGHEAKISNVTNASVNDINSKDKYIEIIACSSARKKLTIYHWNGKKPVVYASAKLTSELTRLSKKNYCYAPGYYILDCKSNGKGRLTVKAAMVIRNNPCIVDLNYKVSNGKIEFDSSSYVPVDNGVFLKVNQAGKAWQAFRYPRIHSNPKVFALAQGEKIRTLQFKITSQYTYMQVKRVKNNQTGWIVFRTKDIDRGNQNFNPYE